MYFVPVALVVALFVSDALFAFVVAKGGGGGGRGGGGGSLGGGGSRGSGSGGGGSMPILSNHGNRSSSPSRFYDHRDRVLAFGCVVLVAFVLFFWDFIDYSMPCNHGGDSNIWEIKVCVILNFDMLN